MRIRLAEDRKDAIVRLLKDFYSSEFDEELSTFRAQHILRFFLKTLGPPLYNQAIHDA